MGTAVAFGSGRDTVSGTWTEIKAIIQAKRLPLQYVQLSGEYKIFAFDDNLAYTCEIWTGTVPDGVIAGGYSQSQNDSDKSDFETNSKNTANQRIDKEGFDDPRLIYRFGNATLSSTSEVLVYGRTYTEQSSEAQRSVVSTSANDAYPSGTGARTIRITYLTSNYVLKTEDINLNGTTAVNTAASDIRFIEGLDVIAGSLAAGAVKLMSTTAGGGTEVMGISASTTQSQPCHHYIPAGKRCYVIRWGAVVDNNASLKLLGQERADGVNLVSRNWDVTKLSSDLMFITFMREMKGLVLPEKSYVRVTTAPAQVQSTVVRGYLTLFEESLI